MRVTVSIDTGNPQHRTRCIVWRHSTDYPYRKEALSDKGNWVTIGELCKAPLCCIHEPVIHYFDPEMHAIFHPDEEKD